MSMVSHNHYVRHLTDSDEILNFERTAPILTTGYWDLADAVHAPIINADQIVNSAYKVQLELDANASPLRSPNVARLVEQAVEVR